jgi:hypothetical protein
MKAETTQSSKKMLHLLRDLVSDSEEVYNGIVWQLVCCPFTPFLTLFGEILANKGPKLDADREALAAMQELPLFLKNMGLRNTLAAKLERIAVVIVQHAESVVGAPGCEYRNQASGQHQTNSKSDTPLESMSAPSTATSYLHNNWPTTASDFDWDSFLNHTTTTSFPFQAGEQDSGGELIPLSAVEDATLWTDMFLGDANIDWIGLGDTLSA